MKSGNIPAPAIKRLSLYLRDLEEYHERGERTVSSRQLGENLNLSDAQVRKDLAYFGPSGHPGIGYGVKDLIDRIRHVLGTDKTWKVIIVGAGNLGRALAAYKGFVKKGFQLVAVFDTDESKIDRPLPGCEELKTRAVAELPELVRREGVRMGILVTPASCAQQVADEMIAAGIKGILNFAPVMLTVPDDVAVAGVDLAVRLEQLSFKVRGACNQELTPEAK